jgi:hypothetical protein
VPRIYFAGSITQGHIGLKKYGRPGGSAAVHGFRYNARVLAEHLAEKRFGIKVPRKTLEPHEVVPYLLAEATRGPELWHQQSYLARALTFNTAGIVNEGITPLSHFVDSSGPDAVVIAVETDDRGDIHPALYRRREGRVDEHELPGDPLLDFETQEHRGRLEGLLKGFLR